MDKKIAVYCASSLGIRQIYRKQTLVFAKWMIEEQFDLVYGGSRVGLMGILSSKLLENNRKVYGVLPNFLKDKEIAQENLTELFLVEGMHQRKQKMIDLADVFIAMPGGPGTLEEISEVISWSRIGQNDKPCIFYNIAGYYNGLAAFFDTMVAEGFLSERDRKTILFTESLPEIKKFIDEYEAPKERMYDKPLVKE